MAYCDFLAGVFAGGCNMVVSHPLDTVKTNMQSGNMPFFRAAMTVIKDEGIRGCYRGFLFPLMSTGFFNSIIFGVYGNSFRILQDLTKEESTKQKLWFHHVFWAGCCGGVLKAIAACPIELTKVRLQVRVHNATGPLMVVKHIYKNEGSRGLFKGLTAMLWRDAVPYGIFMLVYEYLLEQQRNQTLDTINTKNVEHYKSNKIDPLKTAIAGACAGMISWIPAVPFDVVKTRMMVEVNPKRFRSMWHCFSVIIAESGYRSLFRGGTLLILRSAPVSAIQFLGYEFLLSECQARNKL